MGRIGAYAGLLAAAVAGLLSPQNTAPAPREGSDEPVVVSTEHPRLFLRPARLRLLRRERERQSMRWRQFEALIAGNAPMPEPGFAAALDYQASGNAAAGHRAIAWALGNTTDLRQMALVYDWCQTLLSDAERRELAARIARRMAETAPDDSIPAASARALAAVALFDEVPQVPDRELNRLVHKWWNGTIAPALRAGHNVVPRETSYALMELLHALADNTRVDLRESCPGFFRDFPIEHLMGYYPAPYPGAQNEYYIGVMRHPGEPDPRAAALDRAAELAMVAYDPNAPETQVLQGWLMHDRFLMRSTFGSPYEFLWANPYQPGLSYYNVPLVYYNPDFGRLFLRSSWEDDADWFGLFDGTMQMFTGGHATAIDAARRTEPLWLKEATICFAGSGRKFQLTLDEPAPVFVVSLEPRHAYEVEVDDEEMFEAASDAGGILELDDVPAGRAAGVRMK
jgi:hypothetical protein